MLKEKEGVRQVRLFEMCGWDATHLFGNKKNLSEIESI